jgi:hypothetical protein
VCTVYIAYFIYSVVVDLQGLMLAFDRSRRLLCVALAYTSRSHICSNELYYVGRGCVCCCFTLHIIRLIYTLLTSTAIR